jgi:hypothetical protein
MSEWTDPKNFKSYDELKARLAVVLGENAPRTVQQSIALDETASYSAPSSSPQPTAPVAAPTPIATAEDTSIEEDDTMSYFAKLAAED